MLLTGPEWAMKKSFFLLRLTHLVNNSVSDNQGNMAKSKIIYEDRPTVYAKFDHPQLEDYIEYKSIIQSSSIKLL
ncbi:hypothetical protein BMR05_15555 [Methylococcaceae bacterium HT4]|uniref:hypothetical protein n=1 Tax=Bathymodiolus platifrons methanotrophic gill symbiont TaxID=113268 RepID=UPI000B41611D|nr:hypothetical protein [Bathymodiolus platifrons methanotrophic gill symbiont]TXL10920.1 hypothetical protein BMR04_16190 [Methylococcaceae bacterium HT3]TXL12381.1 hypothetical protein BMR05_15555 [Methylococcaceae bacterium HT4]TXL16653.1 hypothetical protein BMR06_15605 [Methylococcaceae bacterium HT5]TXL19996.1 hypothetical protein BMR03_14755 [Methylococcaceae bacterium HT2]